MTSYFKVNASHVAPQYAALDEVVEVRHDGSRFYAQNKRGCGKSRDTEESAVRYLFENDGCTRIVIERAPTYTAESAEFGYLSHGPDRDALAASLAELGYTDVTIKSDVEREAENAAAEAAYAARQGFAAFVVYTDETGVYLCEAGACASREIAEEALAEAQTNAPEQADSYSIRDSLNGVKIESGGDVVSSHVGEVAAELNRIARHEEAQTAATDYLATLTPAQVAAIGRDNAHECLANHGDALAAAPYHQVGYGLIVASDALHAACKKANDVPLAFYSGDARVFETREAAQAEVDALNVNPAMPTDMRATVETRADLESDTFRYLVAIEAQFFHSRPQHVAYLAASKN